HPEKFEEHGGEAAVLTPVPNVLVGAQILKEYIRRSGSLESGLQRYNGAPNDATLQFAHRVMAELARIRDVILRIDRDERQLPKA
ncbi:MAG: hypothetical protein IT514_03625, partial [Burkholderiales bacterium]|nr:hypothetical protein [Burkholderiales bacterium]